MFWGKGDSARLEDGERETLTHLRRLVETGHIVALDTDLAKIALRAIDFYSQWESVLRLLNSIKNVALMIGALLAIWWASQGAILGWIASNAP